MTVEILVGDAIDRLAELPDKSIQCCITSPPYWGLRSYKGDKGMIGLEPTFAGHLDNLVAVFQQVRRVLRDDGTLWLNYGDAYSNSSTGGHGAGGGRDKSTLTGRMPPVNTTPLKKNGIKGLKPKNLMMMPARAAIALQEDGWLLRSEIVWHKPNPMPESVRDRPTSAHEKIFLFSKSAKYFYDHVAVRTEMKPQSIERLTQPTFDTQTGGPKDPKQGNRSHRKVAENLAKRLDKQRGHGRRHAGFNERWDNMTVEEQMAGGANLRNVWSIAVAGFKEAHFATFPPDLIKPCFLAGTSKHGSCSECGAPYKRVSNSELTPTKKAAKTAVIDDRDMDADPNDGASNRQKDGHIPGWRNKYETTGWQPTCQCNAEVQPCTVLDPFAGSGTVGLVADQLGVDAVLIEISREYADMAKTRIRRDSPLYSNVKMESEA